MNHTPKELLKIYSVSFGVFFMIDLLWLGVIGRPIYNHFLGSMLASPPNWPAAIVFYSLFIVGLNYFALLPALSKKSRQLATKNGAAYGFFTYMTYELTNYAVIKGWPLGIVPIDIAWGTFLALAVTLLSYKILDSYVLTT